MRSSIAPETRDDARKRTLVEVQQLVGHSTIQMTMRYAHLSPDVKRDAVEALEKPSGKVGH